VRTPLNQLCLTVRALDLAPVGPRGIESFLLRAVTPPSDKVLNPTLGPQSQSSKEENLLILAGPHSRRGPLNVCWLLMFDAGILLPHH
jgi:hypothetical protein